MSTTDDVWRAVRTHEDCGRATAAWLEGEATLNITRATAGRQTPRQLS
jgi:hypothetical protein